MSNYIEQEMFSWSSGTHAMGEVLKKWREEKGFSLYSIAKYEDNEQPRTELFKKVEEGRGSMRSLLMYFDFIGWKDREFLHVLLTKWWKQMGFE